MFYMLEDDDRKFGNIKTARKYAIQQFGYYKDIGIANPRIKVYEGNYVGRWEIGVIKKGPGYPVYITTRGPMKIYRISPSGDVRSIRAERKKSKPAPFGL